MIDSYDKLTIEKAYLINDILDDGGMEEIDKQVNIIAVLSDMTEDEVLDLPLSEYETYVAQMNFLSEIPKARKRIPNRIKLGNRNYVVLKDVSKMTAGQYIDFQTYSKNNMGLEYLLSTLILPEGEKYGESDTEEVISEIRKNMTFSIALDITSFFQRALLRSIKITLIYLGWKMRMLSKANPEMKMKLTEVRKRIMEMEHMLPNGDGSFL